MQKSTKYFLVSSKIIFWAFLLTVVSVCLIVFVTGLVVNRTLFENTLISLTVLSVCFFLFLFIGLYQGLRLKESMGDIGTRIQWSKKTKSSGDGIGPDFDMGFPDIDGEGIVFAILFWVLATVALIFLFFFFETFLVASFWTMVAGLYWVFYRAVRLVLKNRRTCRGHLTKSLGMALGYTGMYVGWLYGLVLCTHYFA